MQKQNDDIPSPSSENLDDMPTIQRKGSNDRNTATRNKERGDDGRGGKGDEPIDCGENDGIKIGNYAMSEIDDKQMKCEDNYEDKLCNFTMSGKDDKGTTYRTDNKDGMPIMKIGIRDVTLLKMERKRNTDTEKCCKTLRSSKIQGGTARKMGKQE